MNYKKLVSLFAVSTLALTACGTTDDAKETPTDETAEVEETPADDKAEETSEALSPQELMKQAQDQAGDAFPEYGLYIAGAWTQEGIVVQHAPGEAATVPVQITTDHTEYNVYLLEDGVITQVVSNEPEPAISVESPSSDVEYVVGISPDDLGAEGDEVAVDDFYRSEVVVFEEAAPAADEE